MEKATVTEGTRRYVMRFVRSMSDASPEDVSKESGVPLYLVKRVLAMAAKGIRRGL